MEKTLFLGDTITSLWDNVYSELKRKFERGNTHSCRGNFAGNRVASITGAHLILDNPGASVVLSRTRNMSLEYLLAELSWYWHNTDKWEDISRGKKIWQSLSDDGIHVNSNYGHKMMSYYGFNQLNHCVELLRKDRYSRQAVIHIKPPSNAASKDVCCTLTVQFIFNNTTRELDCITSMRSCDIWNGLVYDAVFFTMLQQYVANHCNMLLGAYHHIVGDLHLYDKNLFDNAHTNEVLLKDYSVKMYSAGENPFIMWNSSDVAILRNEADVAKLVNYFVTRSSQFSELRRMNEECKNAKQHLH